MSIAELTSMQGKRVLVTGAASGIGRAIAQQFATAAAAVILLDLNEQALEQAASEISTSTGAACSALTCDVSNAESVQRAFGTLNGKLDVLVNSAGVAHIGTVSNTSPEDFDRLYRVNVRGTFLCMQAAAAIMAAAKCGVILNMASIAATSGLKERFAYSMTKGGVLSMTLSAARDLLADGIRCNCISPARVHTPFVDGFVAKYYPGREQEMFATLAASQPIGRMGTPDEVATLALFLCSDAAAFITGSDVPIDGGFMTIR